MVYINSEGNFNDNTFFIDLLLFRLPHQFSLYIIENNGKRMLIEILKKGKEWAIGELNPGSQAFTDMDILNYFVCPWVNYKTCAC